MKRLFDLTATATALGLLLLAVPLLGLAWLVRRKLGSPIFFTQVRNGIRTPSTTSATRFAGEKS